MKRAGEVACRLSAHLDTVEQGRVGEADAAAIVEAVDEVIARQRPRLRITRVDDARPHAERRFLRRPVREQRAHLGGERFAHLLVGIDVIGDFLTEINVTSPTGIRAIKALGGPDIAARIWDVIAAKRGG